MSQRDGAAHRGPLVVDRRLEFLLILSALLSAVTGAFTGTRAPDARPQQVAASSQHAVTVAVVPAATVASRAAPIFDAARPAIRPMPPQPVLAAPIPLYADRLRE
jgi:hypothetical protein